MNALFLYNPLDLEAPIQGGVQICTKEFLEIIKATDCNLNYFEVSYSKSLIFRILHKINFDLYQAYTVKKYRSQLLAKLIENNITHVFINKAELIRFAKIIKESDLPLKPKVIIMSHGNESGDLLGDITGTTVKSKGLKKIFGTLKLGIILYLESFYRKNYVDLVCTMSEEECAIEKWLGMNTPFFIPRIINKSVKISRNAMSNIYGYVGTLNHVPNITALRILLSSIAKQDLQIELKIVGQPKHIGEELASKYPFIKYLGPLTEKELLSEVENWSFFINPIFNYSRGASMKLAKAIEWEIPIITTTAGRRGYYWENGYLLESKDNVVDFIKKIKLADSQKYEYDTYVDQLKSIKVKSPNVNEIGSNLAIAIANLK